MDRRVPSVYNFGGIGRNSGPWQFDRIDGGKDHAIQPQNHPPAGAAALVGLALPAYSQGNARLPTIRIGTLENGTVNWEIETIRRRGLDVENGFRLLPLILAGNPATQVAMQGGEVDTIVSDWLWVAQQRSRGTGSAFCPTLLPLAG
ncbi:hypothetical protein ACFSS8_21120 [Paracoccus kondratievae]